MIKEPQRNNELVELHFQGVGITYPQHVVTFQLRVYCTSNGHRYMAGETEFVPAHESPAFRKAVRLDYLPNCQQTLEIFCAESDNPTLPTVGKADVEFGVLVDTGEGLTVPLISKDKLMGQLFITSKQIVDDKSSYHIGFNCLNVKNLEFFSTSDPYVIVFRPTDPYINALNHDDVPQTGWIALHQTDYKKHDLNPCFNPFGITKWSLSRANPNVILKFEIWDHSKFGLHRKISTAYTTVDLLANGDEKDKFLNTFDEKGKFGGTIAFYRFEEKKFFMLDQYINAGIEIRLVIAVDCSGSTKSLHNIKPDGQPDLFERAIREVSDILVTKEKTGRFAFLGFGAKINGYKHPTFPFNHAKSERNPSVKSVDEAISLYKSVYPTIEPEEPTNLAGVIERVHVMMKHQDKKNYKIYTLLVILTDGDIEDRQESIDKVVECSDFPLSIVLVGVGQGNFDHLEYLESGYKAVEPVEEGKKKKKTLSPKKKIQRLKSTSGKEALRRIVRFVYYQNYLGKHKELEEALIRDVPRQMTEFYNLVKFDPCPASPTSQPTP